MSNSGANSAAATWDLIVAKTRIDSFNHDLIVATVRKLRDQGKTHIALDLKNTRFLSLAAIKFIVSTAQQMQEAGGQLALVSPSEKTKRHFEIYGTLGPLRIFRAASDLLTAETHDLVPTETHGLVADAAGASESPVTDGDPGLASPGEMGGPGMDGPPSAP